MWSCSPPSGFDGGDCCECTCVDTVLYECGDASRGGFDCLDPSVDPSISCDSDDDVWGSYSYEYSYEYDMSPMASDSGCLDSLIRDGNCDSENNSAACGESSYSQIGHTRGKLWGYRKILGDFFPAQPGFLKRIVADSTVAAPPPKKNAIFFN